MESATIAFADLPRREDPDLAGAPWFEDGFPAGLELRHAGALWRRLSA